MPPDANLLLYCHVYSSIIFFPHQFDREGYAIIQDFLSEEEVMSLRAEMATIIENLDPNEHRSVFRTENQVMMGLP